MNVELITEFRETIRKYSMLHNSKIAIPEPIVTSLHVWKEKLTNIEHNVLTILYNLQDNGGTSELTMGEMAKLLSVRQNNLTNIVSQLVKKGLLLRYQKESNRRSVYIALSEKGRKYQEEDIAIHSEYNLRNFSRLISTEELEKIIEFFNYYCTILEQFN